MHITRSAGFLLIASAAFAAAQASARDDGCIDQAAVYHQVSPLILRAILTVESGMRAGAVNRNDNGTLDVGIGQINSIHFRSLGGYGIAPEQLLDACVGTYVAAWHLKRQMLAYGNTWFAVGAYHSVTPQHNLKYQNLVYRQLLRMDPSLHASRGAVAQVKEVDATAVEQIPYIGTMAQ